MTASAATQRLLAAHVERLIRHHEVDSAVGQRARAFGGRIHDRLLVDVERGVDQRGEPGGASRRP